MVRKKTTDTEEPSFAELFGINTKRAATREEPPALAFTINEFCRSVRISRRLFYKLRATNCGPKIIKLGKKVLITPESARAWLEAQEGGK